MATTTKARSLPDTTTDIENTIDGVTSNPILLGAITSAASGITPKTRKIVYYVGIALGLVVAAASTVGAALTGNVADVTGSIGGIAYSLSNLLAAAHLNVPVANAAVDASK